jgi:hypothetical protein
MLNTYYFKSFFKYAIPNILGFIIWVISCGLYLSIFGNKEILSNFYILIFLIITILLGFQCTHGYLIYAKSTKLYCFNNRIEIHQSNIKPIIYYWDSILRIELQIEKNNLLNMYVILNNENELRFILKKKWLMSIVSKKSAKANFEDLELLFKSNPEFENKFNQDLLIDFRKYFKL